MWFLTCTVFVGTCSPIGLGGGPNFGMSSQLLWESVDA
jgi:hypothetical protein